MLSSTPGPYTESTLVGAMSSVYLGDLALAAAQRDAAGAFNILERVRGRTAADMLRNHTWAPYESASSRELEIQLSRLQVRLIRSDDASERGELLDNIVEVEEKLSYNRDPVDRHSLRMSTHPIPLRLAQDMLRPDEVLLEYVRRR
jgi:hypothetical protein